MPIASQFCLAAARARTLSFTGAIAGAALLSGLVHIAACGSSKQDAACANPGGPTAGVQDAHCASTTPQVVDATTCGQTAPDEADGSTAGSSTDANSIYGPTMYGTQGNDDDCKYNVVWHAEPICENTDVTFYVTPTYLADGSKVTGAMPRLEVFLNDTTPAPNTVQKFTETSPGTYSVGPIRFDKPGQWTIRWHLFEYCSDFSEASPHGHAAFYVTVP